MKKSIQRRDRRILKKVNVGGEVYSVKYPYHFVERTDIYGRVIFDERTILIGNVAGSGNRAKKDHTWGVYWHELVHVLNRVFCSDQIGEDVDMEGLIDSIGRGVARILSDNYYLVPKKKK